MSDSDEPQVIQSDSEESFADTYYESVDEDNDGDDDDEDDDDDDADDDADDDDADDDDDYDDKDLMKSVLNNTQKSPIQTTNGTAQLYLQPKPSLKPLAKYRSKRKKNIRSYQICKKRSIKCLNNKVKRDKYKSFVKDMFSKKNEKTKSMNRSDSVEIVCIDEPQTGNDDIVKVVEMKVTDEVKTDYNNVVAQEVVLVTNEEAPQSVENGSMDVEIITPDQKAGSPAPVVITDSSKKSLNAETQQSTNNAAVPPPNPPSTPLNLYKEINELFPKYNKVLSEHVENCDDPLTKSIDGNMLQLENEVKTINDLINQKELEWNRLLHLRRVKEEIIERLHRQKQKLHLTNKQFCGNAKTLSELKELEHYLANANTPYSINTTINSTDSNFRHGSVAQLINNRANMKKEELYNENQIINRLQKFLEKNKILTKVDNSNKSTDKVLSDERANTRSPPHNSNAYAARTNNSKCETMNDYGRTMANPYKPAARKYSELNDFVARTEAQNSAPAAVPAYTESELKKTKYSSRNEFPAPSPYERPTSYGSLKRKSVDLADEYVEITANPYKQSSSYPNLKRKHFQIADDCAEDIPATPPYKETVYQLYPQNHCKNSNGIDALLHKNSTNNFILNTLTPNYRGIQVANPQHSTPFIHGQHDDARKVDKQTFSILETSSDEATLINGNELYSSPYIKLQQINKNATNYDEPPPQQQYHYNGHSKQRNAGANKKFILNGHSFVNNRIDVIADEDGSDNDDELVRQLPSCQECNVRDSRIACSGCLKQWYCSRDCQVAAWSHHSRSCRK